MTNQMSQSPEPETIDRLRYAVDSAFAMLAGMQLDVFTPLKDGPMTAGQIADAIGVGPNRLSLLLYGLVPAGLLTVEDGLFTNTHEAQHFLVKDNPSYIGNMFAPLLSRWEANLKTAESIRTGSPQARLDFSDSPPEEVEAFLRRINASTVDMARKLLDRYDFSSIKSLVDVGGGGGGLAITMVKEYPQLQATVIDLPQVTTIAQKIVEEEGVADRVTIIASDVVNHPVPGSYDVAVMRTLLQVLPSTDAQQVVQNVSGAILPGGSIYIGDWLLDDSRISPPGPLGFNLFAINLFEAGAAYTEHEGRSWLSEAGFVDINRVDFLLAGGLGLMTARKPR